MKNILYITILGWFFLTTTASFAQQATSNALLGTWEVDYPATTAAAASSGSTQYQEMDASVKAEVSTFYIGLRFTFSNDGSYSMAHTNGTIRTGTWSLSNGLLTLIDASNGIHHLYSLSQNAPFLIMRQEGEEGEQALFRSLYLKRKP
ncbi:hypothetical protein ABW636_11580 [Aquimarina sp. 2201CG1-2-11]|uniref:hypothetical protein n=1 Tax=Aquimarina discodermiae TaxID=3231043 RepID=UPI0034629FBC